MYNDVQTGDPQDKRFFGLYRGVVVSTDDPTSQSRLRVLVPQVLGSAITGWAWPLLKSYSLFNNGTPYGFFASSVTQTSTTGVSAITLNSNPVNNNISLTSSTRIQFQYGGVYSIVFNGQIKQLSNGNPEINIWLRVNGNNEPDSTWQFDLSNQNHYAVPSFNYMREFNAGDYIEFYWTSTATVYLDATAAHTTAPIYPATPSVAVSINYLGSGTTLGTTTPHTPNAGDSCWVMFEGGDPNFPIWCYSSFASTSVASGITALDGGVI
jgi:hypothetical protein